MLVLTDKASSVIRALNDRPELPDEAGLRIAGPADSQSELAISQAINPDTEDQVIEQEGARVFLDPAAAELLDDMVLDADVDPAGKIAFSLAAQ
jgi:iron-sulfur cluster assembly protein